MHICEYVCYAPLHAHAIVLYNMWRGERVNMARKTLMTKKPSIHIGGKSKNFLCVQDTMRQGAKRKLGCMEVHAGVAKMQAVMLARRLILTEQIRISFLAS